MVASNTGMYICKMHGMFTRTSYPAKCLPTDRWEIKRRNQTGVDATSCGSGIYNCQDRISWQFRVSEFINTKGFVKTNLNGKGWSIMEEIKRTLGF